MITNLKKLSKSFVLIGREKYSSDIETLIKNADEWEKHLEEEYPEAHKEFLLEKDIQNVRSPEEWSPPSEWKSYTDFGREQLRLAFIWHKSTPKGYDKSYRSFTKWYDEQRVINAFRKGQIDPSGLPHLSPEEATTMIAFGGTGK